MKDPIFNSAPIAQPETVFVIQDSSGLLGQLFLTNRYMGTSPGASQENTLEGSSSSETTSEQTVARTIIDSLDSVILDEYE